MDMLLSPKDSFVINPFLIGIKMGPKKYRREYFRSYYKNLSDEKKEELRKKKKEAYKKKKLANILDAEVSSSTKITFGGIIITK